MNSRSIAPEYIIDISGNSISDVKEATIAKFNPVSKKYLCYPPIAFISLEIFILCKILMIKKLSDNFELLGINYKTTDFKVNFVSYGFKKRVRDKVI